MKILLVLGSIALQVLFCSSQQVVPPPFQRCNDCPQDPCLGVHKTCPAGESLTADKCRCICGCAKPGCKPCPGGASCAAVSCFIGNSVATKDECDCSCSCKPCIKCAAVLCTPTSCKPNENCVQICGCAFRCFPKPCDPCEKTKCKNGYTCVANKQSCTARCERVCPHCTNGANLCANKECDDKEFCETTCVGCRATCRALPFCRRNPCSGGLCRGDQKCISDFKKCTHTCLDCPKFKACPFIFAPVCGTDGKTYSNNCVLEDAICKSRKYLRKLHDGPCKCKTDACKKKNCRFGARCIQDKVTCQARCDCPLRLCTNEVKPICGTDGRTYQNDCFLATATCRTQGRIRKAKDGKCCGKNKCLVKPNFCGPKRMCRWNPLTCKATCPSTLRCRFVLCQVGARCIEDSNKCTANCVCSVANCPRIKDPVCGTDGVTYPNQCFLNFATCRTSKIPKPIRLKSKGRCPCPDNCATKKKDFCPSAFNSRCAVDLDTCEPRCTMACRPNFNPCSGIRCGRGRKCVPNVAVCAYSCQPIVCPPFPCPNIGCNLRRCKQGRCLNLCPLSCAAACQIRRGCHKPCPEEYKPVCSSDFRTFRNQCYLEIAQCKSIGSVFKRSDGACPGTKG